MSPQAMRTLIAKPKSLYNSEFPDYNKVSQNQIQLVQQCRLQSSDGDRSWIATGAVVVL